MSTNKLKLVKVYGYGATSANEETANSFYIFRFTSVPYTSQEDVESDGKKISYGDIFCNAIYTSPGNHKSRFYVDLCNRRNYDCVNEHSCYSKS